MIKYKMPGCLYGQAISDAIELGTEFLSKNEVLKVYPNGISKYEDIIQDAHHHRWHKGAWTDDTDMMICIMTAFEDGHFNVHQVATEQTINIWQADPLRPHCISSCVIATAIIHNLVWNNSELSYNDERIAEWVDIAYHNTYISNLDLDELSSIGYTLRTLSAALILYRKSI